MTHASSPTVVFWAQAFGGATPPSALGLALKEGLVPQEDLDTHGHAWFSAWLAGAETRFHTVHHASHRPWRQACGAGRDSHKQIPDVDMPPRLLELDTDHADAGLVAVFEGFLGRGVDAFGPLLGQSHLGSDGVGAAVALNFPAVIDLLARQTHRPSPAELDARITPGPAMGERLALPWLHTAALGWQDTLLEALLDYGLNPNQTDAKGQTPFFHARTSRSVRALMDAGVDPLAQDKRGRTAFEHWEQMRGGFPWGHSAKTLMQAVGEAGHSPAARSSAVVLYAAKSPVHRASLPQWLENFPPLEGPLHAARTNPGGMWKGEWSPAAWLGLNAIQNTIAPHHQVPLLLERDDFFAPDNPSPQGPKGKLTEKGLFGLALALWLGHRKLSPPTDDPSHMAHTGALIDQHLVDRWGADWFWKSPWAPAIQQTSKTLLDNKATSQQLRNGIQLAWLDQFQRARLFPQSLGPALWIAREKGGVRFENDNWPVLFSTLPPPLRSTFLLFQVGDMLDQERRRAGAEPFSVNDALNVYEVSMIWRAARAAIQQTNGNLAKLNDAFDASLEAILDQLATADDIGEFLPLIRARRLEKSLPADPPRRAKHRL